MYQIPELQFYSSYTIVGLTTWTALCTSCDINSTPNEKYIGKMALDNCKKKCLNDSSCTSIDYGKNDANEECCLNYGETKTYDHHNSFDGYIVNRHGGMI